MLTIMKTAASGMLAQKFSLEVVANNIANMSTTAFKKSRAVFASAPYRLTTEPVLDSGEPAAVFRTGTGVRLLADQRLFFQGTLLETGNPWDLAIAGDGFFQVSMPDGSKAYTRDGSFQTDGQGRVVTVEGLLLDPPVTVPEGAEEVAIEENGLVTALVGGERVQLGTIAVSTFPNPEGLLSIGHNLYIASEASGAAQVGPLGVDGRGQIVSGALESSNVDLAEEMTRAIEAQRAYQLNVKALQTADEMLAMANNLRK